MTCMRAFSSASASASASVSASVSYLSCPCSTSLNLEQFNKHSDWWLTFGFVSDPPSNPCNLESACLLAPCIAFKTSGAGSLSIILGFVKETQSVSLYYLDMPLWDIRRRYEPPPSAAMNVTGCNQVAELGARRSQGPDGGQCDVSASAPQDPHLSAHLPILPCQFVCLPWFAASVSFADSPKSQPRVNENGEKAAHHTRRIDKHASKTASFTVPPSTGKLE
jgi:hypothetical protein